MQHLFWYIYIQLFWLAILQTKITMPNKWPGHQPTNLINQSLVGENYFDDDMYIINLLIFTTMAKWKSKALNYVENKLTSWSEGRSIGTRLRRDMLLHLFNETAIGRKLRCKRALGSNCFICQLRESLRVSFQKKKKKKVCGGETQEEEVADGGIKGSAGRRRSCVCRGRR